MSKFNENPIDIVLPWLNPTDNWYAEYKKYCEDENPARIRDLNTMQPTLKGIIKNLPWVRYIWLIIYDEEQIEHLNWPELQHEKVKFLYHRDIIPAEFLPNFNSLMPAVFLHSCDDIADNILFMNDDMIFNHFVAEDNYFEHDLPVHHKTIRVGSLPSTALCNWDYILKTTEKLFNEMTDKKYVCSTWHTPCPVSKDMLKFIDFMKHDVIYDSCKNAKIRRKTTISVIELSYWLSEAYNRCVFKPIYDRIKRKIIVLKDTTPIEEIRNSLNYDIICLNDSEWLINKCDEIKNEIKRSYL